MRAYFLVLIATCIGCSGFTKVLAPSNVRNWSADQAVLSYAQFQGNQITVRNIRHCRYFDDDTYVVNHHDISTICNTSTSLSSRLKICRLLPIRC